MSLPEDPDTDALLGKARLGDQSALERLLARHHDRLCRMVAVRIDDRLTGLASPGRQGLRAGADRLL